MRTTLLWKGATLSALGALLVVVACSANSEKNDVFGPGSGNQTGGEGGGGGDNTGGTVIGTGGGPTFDVGTPQEASSTVCNSGPDEDKDKDGYSVNQGDCNDCDPNANPGAYDVVGGVDGGEGVDEDCDGTVDNEPTDCDDGIAINENDAFAGARAIGLCRKVDPAATGKEKTWGVLSAKWVKADGADGMNPLSHGIVPGFGAANVQQGKSMLVLSSGTARAPGQQGWMSPSGASMGTTCAKPIPNLDSPSCPDAVTGDPNDPAALEVKIRVPTNAKSFKFFLNFYTYEFPQYICSTFNDFYITLMNPKPAGSTDGNISFDQDSNPISVNNSFLQVCTPQNAGGKNFPCPLGGGLLANTGFVGHAATGWLQTVAPVTPGSEVTLRFAIWDSGDEILDSTVLVDNFEWSLDAANGASTVPVPVPK